MKKKIWIILLFLAVIAVGLVAIIELSSFVSKELTVGFISLTFGITAIMWTLKANNRLSVGSSLRKYTTNFLVCLMFLLAFSIWHMLDQIFMWRVRFGEEMIYPEYFFISLAYLTFVIASYQILYLGREFGFTAEAREIKKILEEKNKKKPR